MKTIITSVLLASAFFCMAAPENNNKDSKPARKANTTKIADDKDKKEAVEIKASGKVQDKDAKRKARMNAYTSPWINNNGGGNTSYH